MKNKWKIILVAFVVIAVAGAAIAYAMWNKPQRNVENEKGITIAATQLVKEFQENEAAANTKYLDKAIEVSGTIADVSTNQDGKTTVMLSSDDAFSGVFCTMKEEAKNLSTGNNIIIKGICKGMLSDVRIGDAVVVNK